MLPVDPDVVWVSTTGHVVTAAGNCVFEFDVLVISATDGGQDASQTDREEAQDVIYISPRPGGFAVNGVFDR